VVKPAQGFSPVPLFLAVMALVAASASIGLAAGGFGSSNGPAEPKATVTKPAKEQGQPSSPTYVRVKGTITTLAPAGDVSGEDVGSSTALCPLGMHVVSGGYKTLTGGGETFYSDALTGGRAGWAVGAANNLATSGTVQAFAYCFGSRRPRSQNHAALAREREGVRREMRRLSKRYRAIRDSQL
jgi:hypothetical protein